MQNRKRMKYTLVQRIYVHKTIRGSGNRVLPYYSGPAITIMYFDSYTIEVYSTMEVLKINTQQVAKIPFWLEEVFLLFKDLKKKKTLNILYGYNCMQDITMEFIMCQTTHAENYQLTVKLQKWNSLSKRRGEGKRAVIIF